MKNRKLLIIVVLLSSIILYFFVRDNGVKENTSVKPGQQNDKAIPPDEEQQSGSNNVNQGNGPKNGAVKPKNVTAEAVGYLSKFDKVIKVIEAALFDIDKTVLVVDQDGKPIEGVEIIYCIDAGYLIGNTAFETETTNSEGELNISGRGLTIEFRSIKKEGYYFDRFNYKFLHESEIKDESPHLIKAWKYTIPKNISYVDDRQLKLANTGETHRVGISNKGLYIVKNNNSDLDIQIKVDEGSTRKHPGGWSITVSSNLVGLAEAKSDNIFIAPNDGYNSSWSFKQPKVDEGGHQPSISETKKVFLRKEGAFYGVITFTLAPYLRDRIARIDYSITLNNDFETNLFRPRFGLHPEDDLQR